MVASERQTWFDILQTKSKYEYYTHAQYQSAKQKKSSGQTQNNAKDDAFYSTSSPSSAGKMASGRSGWDGKPETVPSSNAHAHEGPH